jgi:hypothetical protein
MLWSAICKTGFIGSANARQPKTKKDCPEPKVHMSASFLTTILTTNPYKKRLFETGLHLGGVTVEGPLELDSRTVPGNFSISCFDVIGPVSFDRTTFNGSVDFSFGSFNAPVSFTGNRVKGFLTFKQINGISLFVENSKVDRDLGVEASEFSETVSVYDSQMQNLSLQSSEAGMNASGIEATGNVSIKGTISGPNFYMNGAKIDGGVSIAAISMQGALALAQTHIRGMLSLLFSSPAGLYAPDLQVDGPLLVGYAPTALATLGARLKTLQPGTDEAHLKYTPLECLDAKAKANPISYRCEVHDTFPHSIPVVRRLFHKPSCTAETVWPKDAIFTLTDARLHAIQVEYITIGSFAG